MQHIWPESMEEGDDLRLLEKKKDVDLLYLISKLQLNDIFNIRPFNY